jgi:hypothetical protein
VTPEEEAVLRAAREWARARRPVASVGNKEHFARLVRALAAERDSTSDALEVAVAIYEETL